MNSIMLKNCNLHHIVDLMFVHLDLINFVVFFFYSFWMSPSFRVCIVLKNVQLGRKKTSTLPKIFSKLWQRKNVSQNVWRDLKLNLTQASIHLHKISYMAKRFWRTRKQPVQNCRPLLHLKQKGSRISRDK